MLNCLSFNSKYLCAKMCVWFSFLVVVNILVLISLAIARRVPVGLLIMSILGIILYFLFLCVYSVVCCTDFLFTIMFTCCGARRSIKYVTEFFEHLGTPLVIVNILPVQYYYISFYGYIVSFVILTFEIMSSLVFLVFLGPLSVPFIMIVGTVFCLIQLPVIMFADFLLIRNVRNCVSKERRAQMKEKRTMRKRGGKVHAIYSPSKGEGEKGDTKNEAGKDKGGEGAGEVFDDPFRGFDCAKY